MSGRIELLFDIFENDRRKMNKAIPVFGNRKDSILSQFGMRTISQEGELISKLVNRKTLIFESLRFEKGSSKQRLVLSEKIISILRTIF